MADVLATAAVLGTYITMDSTGISSITGTRGCLQLGSTFEHEQRP